MEKNIAYTVKQLQNDLLSLAEVKKFLEEIDLDFPKPLSKKVEFSEYAKKILNKGIVIAAIKNNKIIGIITGYANDIESKSAYISVLGVNKEITSLGIGSRLLDSMIMCVSSKKMEKITLYTHINNKPAISFYEKHGFFKSTITKDKREDDILMEYAIEKKTINILLTSVGRRSYLVNYFKEAIGENGKVHVSNSSSITPAFRYADYSVTSPLIYDEQYIPFLIDYCKKNNINAIISLFDIDLPILSKNKKKFEEIGVDVIVSDEQVIEVCNDKIKTVEFLKDKGIKTPVTHTSLSKILEELEMGNIIFPIIIKPRWGMGSIGVFEANNKEELHILYEKTINSIKNSYVKFESEQNVGESILLQEKLGGQEYGLDIINDLTGNYQTTIVKKKYAMRSGETDAAITEDNKMLKNLGEHISNAIKHIGNLDVDVFIVEGVPYVLEMNARFGGGYPFSHVSGVDLPRAILQWLNGEKVHKEILTEKFGVLSHKDISIVKI